MIFALLIGLWLTSTAHTLECYQCDSVVNVECATRPGQQIEVEECLKENDECATVIVAGHTRRGCVSRLYPYNYCPEPCERCNTSLCNRNIFPQDRLRCYQCLGLNCVDVRDKMQLNLPCPIYHENDRCYTNIIKETSVQRGCEKTDLPEKCSNICLKCNYGGCNNEPGAHEESCLACSHYPDLPNPHCLRAVEPVVAGKKCALEPSTVAPRESQHVKTCTNEVLLGHKGKCFTYINTETRFVQRGCSSKKLLFPSGNFTECYGKNCNNECVDIACSICNATAVTENKKCREGSNLYFEHCSKGTLSCFACEAPNMMRRGCGHSTFLQTENEACYHCTDVDGCNSHIPLRTCYHCSSRDDASCASTTWNPARIAKRRCSLPTEPCVSTVVNKFNMVYVVRGCASAVPDCSEFDPYCVRCNGSLCNTVPIEWNENATGKKLKPYRLNGN